ncbi:MAG TPA: AraC family transcriptional regulator [Rhizomicrobium sp.]|jgi:AraC-like DNA-binding protein|nr:AraC family transcriptional regulator [Rhizomicrobium sp.]
MLQRFRGVSIRRVIDRSDARVPEHAHDWPLLSVFVLGGYWNRTELGRKFIAGPSAILYRERAAHENRIAASGFEQIELEFDPAWLGRALLPTAPVSHWTGGRTAREVRILAQICSREISEPRLRVIVQRFIEKASRESERETPIWVDTVIRRLRESTTVKVCDLAREVQRHPSWLGAAYRRATGEGILETAARFRVERAARLLRETDLSSAGIAAEAGFCDQSHMNRRFRRVLGRRPSAVRNDRHGMRQDWAEFL